MNTHTPFTQEYATSEVAKNLQPFNASGKHPLSLKKAEKVLSVFAQKKMWYPEKSRPNTDEQQHILSYIKQASEDELLGQWARCAINAYAPKMPGSHLNIHMVISGYPLTHSMSQSFTKLEYMKSTVFEGSAWDLILDMLVVPQDPEQIPHLSRAILDWCTTNNSGINEKPNYSSPEKMAYLWEGVQKRAPQVLKVLNSTPDNDQVPQRTALCDVIPQLFMPEEMAFKLVADPLVHAWLTNTCKHHISGLSAVLKNIMGSSMDSANKTSITQHLLTLTSPDAMQKALRYVPTQKIEMGLWKSYFAVAQGCGVSPEHAVKLHHRAFAQSLETNVSSSIMMDRYLPIFKTTEGVNHALSNLPYFLWKRSLVPNALPMEAPWLVLQKHDIAPKSLSWSTVQEELKGLSSYTDADHAQDLLNTLLQNHRLNQEILDVIEPAQTSTIRRRM